MTWSFPNFIMDPEIRFYFNQFAQLLIAMLTSTIKKYMDSTNVLISLSTDVAAMIQRQANIQRTQRPMRMRRLQPKALGRGRISIGDGGLRRRYTSYY